MERSIYTGRDDSITTYFTGKASLYNRCRPTYPIEAARWVLEHLPPSPVLADVGAGTGISTRLFASCGARVIGIEPNDEMRATAEASSRGDPAVSYRAGTAEHTGLDDASVDGIVCAQAFHWFDPEPTFREFHRIGRPGGWVALLWNAPNPLLSVVDAEYVRLMDLARARARSAGRAAPPGRFLEEPGSTLFDRPRKRIFPNPVSYTVEDMLDRARSASYFPESGPVAEELTARLRAMFDEFEVEGRIEFQQECRALLMRRVDGD